ncbi:hypothetical protein WJX73_001349 [Symbiochloris irregularis]|uniref:Protein kinase domain-containing protein n=1 Tax=Symbiochloris irregularis TaxID=706552 RepID=A0AAW1PYX1_9CHLO
MSLSPAAAKSPTSVDAEQPAGNGSCLLDVLASSAIFKPCWANKQQHHAMSAPDSLKDLTDCDQIKAGDPQPSLKFHGNQPPKASDIAEAPRPVSNDSDRSMHDSACSVRPRASSQDEDMSRSSSNGTISPQDSLLASLQASIKEDEVLQPHLPDRSPDAAQLQLPQWLISPYDLSFSTWPDGKLCRLGTGTFGTVYRGLYKGCTVAIKVCKHKWVDKRAMDGFTKEVTILYNYRHPNIVSFKGACTWQGGKRTVILTSFMERGDVYEALGRHPARYKWRAHGKRIALDVARGLQFLHSHNIVHFDLKSANILLDRHHRVQIADVGLSKTLTNYHNDRLATFMATTDLGTFAWSAPEVLLGHACDAKADIYSFGVVLWELATVRPPSGRDLKPIKVPEEGCAELAKIIARCLMHSPADRPSASQLVTLLQALQ